MVLDETTEEGRLFQTEIVLGKMSFSGHHYRHHYRQIVLYTVIHAMPEFALGWVPGSGICLYQETLYRSVSCRRRLRRTALCGTAGMATQARQAYHRRYCLLHLLHLLSLSFMIGMPNRGCILKLRMNQCFVCNFFCMPRCQCQIAPKKAQSLSCLACNFRNMLTPIKVVCDS